MNLKLLAPLVAASWLAVGCTPPPPMHPYAHPTPPGTEQTAIELSRLRGLPLDAPIPTVTVDDATFLRAFHDMTGAEGGTSGHLSEIYGAFGTTAGKVDVDAMASRVLDDNLLGFYDPHTKQLYLRRGARVDGSILLAHEEEHALQDRAFGIPDLKAITNSDQALALRAVFEGDATLSSVVLRATHNGETSAVAIARVARLPEQDDAAALRVAELHAPPGAPPLLRAEVLWPYLRGAAFMAQLTASGGWALANEAMRNPPRTTEQVLHVEKYLAGERAVPVAFPAAPAGYERIALGTMGELRTRFLLAECMRDSDAALAATGWGGDSFAVVGKGAERALLWSTVWDDPEAAARFTRALEDRRACARTGPKPDFVVQRSGARVALVQGMDTDPARSDVTTSLLALVGATPPSVPPLGRVSLRSRPPTDRDFFHGGAIVGKRFEDRPLGLESDLTDLVPMSLSKVELLASGQGVSVSLGFNWAPPSQALMDTYASAFVQEIQKKAIYRGPVLEEDASHVALAWTSANARTLHFGDKLDVKMLFAPTCQGKMTIYLVAASKPDTFGGDVGDTWLKSVRATASSPACTALETLRDPFDTPK